METGKKAWRKKKLWWCCWIATIGLMLTQEGCGCSDVKEYTSSIDSAKLTVHAKGSKPPDRELHELKHAINTTLKDTYQKLSSAATKAGSSWSESGETTNVELKLEEVFVDETAYYCLLTQHHQFMTSKEEEQEATKSYVLVLGSIDYHPLQWEHAKANVKDTLDPKVLFYKEGQKFLHTIIQPCTVSAVEGEPPKNLEILKELNVLDVSWEVHFEIFYNKFVVANMLFHMSAYITPHHPIQLPNYGMLPKLAQIHAEWDTPLDVHKWVVVDLIKPAITSAQKKILNGMLHNQPHHDEKAFVWEADETNGEITTSVHIEYAEKADMENVYGTLRYLLSPLVHLMLSKLEKEALKGKDTPNLYSFPKTSKVVYPEHDAYPKMTIEIKMDGIT